MSRTKAVRAASGVQYEPAGEAQRNLAESPLAWLMRRKDKNGRPMLTDAEFDAGEKLRGDFWFAQMTPSVTANWSLLLSGRIDGGSAGGSDAGLEMREAVLAARQRIRRALAAVGPDLAGVLIDVCCHLKGLEASERESGWPQRSGKIILRIALGQLARHYGMTSAEASVADARPVRIRHWGASDYRPAIDGEAQA